MEPIHILRLVDRLDHLRLVDMLRQGQLHQNAVHLRIGIQFGNQPQQLRLRNRLRAADRRVADSDLGRGLRLTRHITHARGIVPHENHHQMGHAPVFCREGLHLLGHFGLQSGRQFFSADNHIFRYFSSKAQCPMSVRWKRLSHPMRATSRSAASRASASVAPLPTTNSTRPPAVTIRSPSAFVPMW